MKILIADDQEQNREILRYILEDRGHECVMAADGREAVAMYRTDPAVGVILMDVNMPGMDGITATRQICEEQDERFVSVIFVTAFDDPEILSRCLEAGGDDFIPQPVNERVLLSKINAHIRNQDTYHKLRQTHESLRYHQRLIEREYQIVERVFANGRDSVATACENLVVFTSPSSLFNGDLVLSAPSPSGGLYVLLGDFTGHGLAAAIGSLPVTGIFYDCAARQASVAEMVTQLNRQLHKLLPVGMYLCAAVMHLQRNGRGLSLWQGGINDALLIKEQKILATIGSDHVPLGIINPADFDSRTQQHELPENARLYFYTDGLSDAKNGSGDIFGASRIAQNLTASAEDRVAFLAAAVRDFQAGDHPTDDISVIEFTCTPCVHRRKTTGEIVDVTSHFRQVESFPWQYRLNLAGADLRCTDVITRLTGVLATVPGMAFHQESLFTIISELFNNALDHGVLDLDSSMKDAPGGFVEYYRLRETRLAALNKESISVTLEFLPGNPNELEIVIADSGPGFDAQAKWLDIEHNDQVHGRGLYLVKSLCRQLRYSDGGSKVTAVYQFT